MVSPSTNAAVVSSNPEISGYHQQHTPAIPPIVVAIRAVELTRGRMCLRGDFCMHRKFDETKQWTNYLYRNRLTKEQATHQCIRILKPEWTLERVTCAPLLVHLLRTGSDLVWEGSKGGEADESASVKPAASKAVEGHDNNLQSRSVTQRDGPEVSIKLGHKIKEETGNDSRADKGINSSIKVEEDEKVKVCDICGDSGQEEKLAFCSRCSDGAEHTYAVCILFSFGDWLCEECKIAEDSESQKQGKAGVVQSGKDANKFTTLKLEEKLTPRSEGCPIVISWQQQRLEYRCFPGKFELHLLMEQATFPLKEVQIKLSPPSTCSSAERPRPLDTGDENSHDGLRRQKSLSQSEKSRASFVSRGAVALKETGTSDI
ncbi:hypothetical protein LINGRAHAP2_LOCUS19516 [Linum grandiflorum]